MERQPSAIANPFWPPIHGEQRVDLPGYPDLVALLRARGGAPEVEVVERPARGFDSFDDLHGFVRRQLWLTEGGAGDRRLVELIHSHVVEREGRWWLDTEPLPIGVVSWRPQSRREQASARARAAHLG